MSLERFFECCGRDLHGREGKTPEKAAEDQNGDRQSDADGSRIVDNLLMRLEHGAGMVMSGRAVPKLAELVCLQLVNSVAQKNGQRHDDTVIFLAIAEKKLKMERIKTRFSLAG